MDGMCDLDELKRMNPSDLVGYLTNELNLPLEDVRELEKRNIDGEAFSLLTREDFAIIYPSNEKFLFSSKLYRIAQQIVKNDGSYRDTNSLVGELSELEGDSSLGRISVSSPSCSHTSTSSYSRSSSRKRTFCSDEYSASKRRHTVPDPDDDCFRLPIFSPDIRSSIRKDSFYTSTQRNRLIKEACIALRGFWWGKEKPVSTDEKKKLAKMLYDLAPKSLGEPDSDSSKPEAGLYGQIAKWFQNHSYLEKMLDKPKHNKATSSNASNADQDDDDEEAVKCHVSELLKEIMKKRQDNNKVCRLLSLTFAHRRNEMLSQTANIRINNTLQKFSCLKKPIHLIQEMFHCHGHRFTNFMELQQKVRLVVTRWRNSLAPAIIRYAEECSVTGRTPVELNDITFHCLTVLIDKLKPRKGKSMQGDPLDAIICFAPTLEEAMKKSSGNTYPYIICIGTSDLFTSSVLVCNKKVISIEIGEFLSSALLTLLAAHYAYELSFNPVCKQVMEFFQEKLVGDKLTSTKKTSTSYSNLFRAINCLEQKICEEQSRVNEDEEISQDTTSQDTQELFDF